MTLRPKVALLKGFQSSTSSARGRVEAPPAGLRGGTKPRAALGESRQWYLRHLAATRTTLAATQHTAHTPSHAVELVYARVALIIPNMGEIERTKDFGFQYVDSPGTLILAHVARGLAGDQSEETK
ncbi:hypothetical protein O3P69_008005 [Scylla paramamosain]|uniref:Uncharacterized protein n=1 Tax=Scylla paramamosain TaxID=85552 RepID=A0AAW0SZB2_SCYPA